MRNKYKQIMSVFVLLIVCTLSMGYAAFGSEMSISNIVADVRIEKDVRVTGVEFVSASNGGINNLDYDHDSVIGNINLKGMNSTVTLAVSVTNFGNTEMGIWDITGLSENLLKTVDGYTLQSKLCDGTGTCKLGSTTTFNITIGYDTYDAVTKDHEIRLDFEFRKMHQVTYTGITNNNYPTSVIDGGNLTFTATSSIPPKIVAFTSTGDRYSYDLYSYVNGTFRFDNVTSDISLKYQEKTYLKTLSSDIEFKESTYKTLIDSVQFVDYVDVSAAIKTYDLSETSGSKEIVAWITTGNDLYIGSEWDIYSKNLDCFFHGMNAIQTIIFNNLNTSECTTLHYMFKDCSSLLSLDLSGFNTTKVTNMGRIFQGCAKLEFLDISSFDTSNVIVIRAMFNGCSSLTSLDVSNFNTSKATVMDEMFKNMSSLLFIDLSSFNTENVTNMFSMFYNCSKLTELDVSKFNTANVTCMTAMFQYCSSISSLDLSNFNTSKVTDMNAMFAQTNSIVDFNISSFNTNNVVYMQNMFHGMESLQTLDLSNFNTSNTINMSGMFYNMKSLTSLNVSSFSTSKVTTMESMFYGTTTIEEIDVTNFNTESVTSFSKMFYGSINLKSLDVSGFNTSSATDMDSMFRYTSLSVIDVSNFDTSNVTDMSYMFRNISLLTDLDLTNFDTSKVTNMSYMFSHSTNLKSIKVSSTLWNTSNVTDNTDMFYNCGVSEVTYV